MDQLMVGVMWYVIFLFATTLHEAAHAWAALRLGDATAYRGGQVSLDPWPHIRREPVGMVLLPIVSLLVTGWPLGWASAPYDADWADRWPRRAGLMALAGPAANLLLVVVAAAGIRAGMSLGAFHAPVHVRMSIVTSASSNGFPYCLARTLSMMFSLNLVLTVFNLLPLPPLDGSAAIALFASDDVARRLRELTGAPGVSMIGLVFAWRVFDPLFAPIFSVALNLLYPGASYG
jgi:Zn-dependent protease